VALSGTLVALGAPNAESDQGVVYIFSCPTPTSCSQANKLMASDGTAGDSFGNSISVSGTLEPTLNLTVRERFTSFLSSPSATTCTQTAKLIASDAAAEDNFGASVSIFGGVVVVGANGKSDNAGAAYIFDCFTSSTCQQTSELTEPSGAAGNQFAWAVSISGSLVVIGSYDAQEKGAAYVMTV